MVYSSTINDATSDDFVSSNPFVGVEPNLRVNALPFRAYEMIYNYYYRNDKNNPYLKNGDVSYNDFIPSHAGGPDDNVYDFHFRNWEYDRYTSAVQSPQFGEAPLVGLTYNADGKTATLQFSAVDTETQETKNYNATVGLSDEGTIASIADFDDDIPSANLRSLQEMVNYGISINVLRMGNAFQHFLENTLRRGLRYRNQLKSHMGVTVDYPDIDVPQYIGGFSGDVDPSQITNMADSPNAGLGDYVGTLSGGVSSQRSITCYCPEHGFIIGIMSITPTPFYSQNCNPVMLKTDAFQYYHPEFGKLGYGPIRYDELMPLQSGSGQTPQDVFAYQKNFSDYMERLNEVHGDFRTTLLDFTLTRTFAERPVLGKDFTVISPDQLNDVWVANNIADAYGSSAKFLCSARFSVEGIRPVNLFGQPSLE